MRSPWTGCPADYTARSGGGVRGRGSSGVGVFGHANAITSVPFGFVQGGVRGAYERSRLDALLSGRAGHANADGETAARHRWMRDVALLDGDAYPLRQNGRAWRVGLAEQHREFLAAIPRDRVAGAAH